MLQKSLQLLQKCDNIAAVGGEVCPVDCKMLLNWSNCMSLLKKVKILVALAAVIIMSANSVYAEFYSVPEELSEYGKQVYASARSHYGRGSFSGYCGTYVRCQLRAMGIFKDQFDVRGNGNQWYSNFENVTQTSGGYYVYRESGADCIKNLQSKYGNELKNIVLSFPIQSGYSAARPGAGHAFVIYELKGNIAYYSESFGFGEYREGEVVAEDIDSLLARYSRRHGSLIGCVMLSEQNIESESLNKERILEDVLVQLSGAQLVSFVTSK